MAVGNGRNVGIIGRIDRDGTECDGQTVKTRTLYRLLCDRYGSGAVSTVDTLNYRSHPLDVWRQLILCFRKCNDIIVLLSDSGRRFLFPLLFLSARLWNKRIYHDLIGGNLAEELKARPRSLVYLNSFMRNWVESTALVQELSRLGVQNAEFLPNFKSIEAAPVPSCYRRSNPVRFCTFSRVCRDKGIGTAVDAVCELNRGSVSPRAVLDIYGPVEDGFAEEFGLLLDGRENVRYCGVVAPEKSVSIVKGYDAVLFPTEHQQEGMPGTIIDALFAGVPVLASQWPYYSDMLEDGQTGFSYAQGSIGGLRRAIDRFLTCSEEKMLEMRQECSRRSEMFSASSAFAKIVSGIEGV